ncbi:uncharacterized protein Nmag_0790 [Natrialba magadii ATCC 43099]|uniref:OB-fold tRNA/helicase-type nucleic acid binding protein n=1 Tax=Natrialba magadii (strain ATCC 43099 / DSM 3394 / CCM 3739 / CIP 104546 / IAM 13178 / JCM 8861 / NBRC 102185 / NCIMB 2190 / MS3) TaxID=547559 RepID=D3T016_NATMM|nr:hypothetical protein [Natrialba magadii]ADD04374.1 uncharacterized protein Nmag_0790 [Natrialba magadii ATCC 43099]ELY26014.1 hypothetical protein C500_16472 [Natrialba magadii ATCC 43099]
MAEPFGQRGRLLAALLLFALLFGLMVWAGASPAEPMEQPGPDETDVPQDRAAYVGSEVTLGGEVVSTDPVVIATRASGYGQFTVVDAENALVNTDDPLESGDQLAAYGTLEDESTLVADRTIARQSSEMQYMYAVSALGGLWVVGRFVCGWRFDRTRLAFVPREQRPSVTGWLSNQFSGGLARVQSFTKSDDRGERRG